MLEPLSDRLRALRAEAEQARWRIQTVTRVGKKLGMHRAIKWPGLRLLLTSLPRGKANPSLLFRFHAENDPDRPALIQATFPGQKHANESPRSQGPTRYTYREMNDVIDRVCVTLLGRGFGRGTSALLLIKNRIEFLLLTAALARIGVSTIPTSWRSTVPELEYLARHSGASAVFFDADIADMIREAIPRLPGVPQRNLFSVGGPAAGFAAWEELIARQRGEFADQSEESALVMYTSGTTGKPKGAVRTFQSGALAAALAFIGETPMALGEPHLVACPIYHATAYGFTTFSVLLGGTVVMMGEFKPELFLDTVERHRIATTALVPTMIHRLTELGPEEIRRHDLSSLKAIFSGGAPLSGPLANEAMDLLGDKLFNFYGSTETGTVTIAGPADLRASPGTIGRAIPGVGIRLINERREDCKIGEVGELFAASRMQVDGYHKDPDATREATLEGFFSVGDLARIDARGCYFIEGRKRDMIISGGVNVYPAEVEGVLHEHPAVAEAAVIGAPDREWGERVRAFVVRRPGMETDAEELKAHCRARLAGPKVPRDFVFLESLPRNPTGKVLKRDLRAMEGA